MKKIAAIILTLSMLCSITGSANAGTNTTYSSTANAAGKGTVTLPSATSRTASATTFAYPTNLYGVINGVFVEVTLNYAYGNTLESISEYAGNDSNETSATVTAPYMYIVAKSASGYHVYGAYNLLTYQGESAQWTSYTTP